MNTPTKSHARSNRELVESYERYLIARGNAAPTIRAYLDGVNRLVDGLGAASVVELERDTIRQTLGQWYDKGLTANSIRLHVCALRSFFKFIRLTGLTKHDPMLLVGYRKLPTRLPVVLTVEQVERLIAAAQDPFERAIMEVLYSTGVRVSELVKLRLEDINRATRTIRVHKGKGRKIASFCLEATRRRRSGSTKNGARRPRAFCSKRLPVPENFSSTTGPANGARAVTGTHGFT